MRASGPSPTVPDTTTFTPSTGTSFTAHTDQASTLRTDREVTPYDVSNILRVDAWEAGLCSCFGSCLNCGLSICLPCVSLAQIAHRIRWAKYWLVLVGLLGLYSIELVVSRFYLSRSYYIYWFDYRAYDYDTHRYTHPTYAYSIFSWVSNTYFIQSRDDETTLHVHFFIGVALSVIVSLCTFLGSLTGLVLIFVTWALRARIRSLFDIPGSCCGDCFVSFCCSCCAVAQMATHVKTYTKGRCNLGPVDTLPAFLPQ